VLRAKEVLVSSEQIESAGDGVVLAVDGGGSKTELVLLTTGGVPLAVARGAGSSPDRLGVEGSAALIDALYREAAARAELRLGHTIAPELAMIALAGADFPDEERAAEKAAAAHGWAPQIICRNDTFAMLRAGTDRDWGVGIVCGTGINCVGVAPSGAVVRFPSLGELSGDWGGGGDVGRTGLMAAIRSEDGRGPKTVLEKTVPDFFGLSGAEAVAVEIHLGRLDAHAAVELSPVVFDAARAGDEVAVSIIDKLAAEIVGFARATITRLELQHEDPDVVLGGSLLGAGLERLDSQVDAGIHAVAPRARLTHLANDPVVGSALLALDAVGAEAQAAATFRELYGHRGEAFRG
jgi:N-acetylglucosamine kinase-like BadF-type ATPase